MFPCDVGEGGRGVLADKKGLPLSLCFHFELLAFHFLVSTKKWAFSFKLAHATHTLKISALLYIVSEQQRKGGPYFKKLSDGWLPNSRCLFMFVDMCTGLTAPGNFSFQESFLPGKIPTPPMPTLSECPSLSCYKSSSTM